MAVMHREIAIGVPQRKDERDLDVTAILEDIAPWLDSRSKRLVDLIGAAIVAIIALPLMLAIALAIVCDDGRPILFRQRRTGRYGIGFEIVKFRTMYIESESVRRLVSGMNEAEYPLFKIAHDDPRVTRVGRVLRRLNLDELPQVINVLRADMSLIGPRPLACHEASALPCEARLRLLVRPGISGIWQVRSDARMRVSSILVDDLSYLTSSSFWLDLRILLRTPLAAVAQARTGRQNSQCLP